MTEVVITSPDTLEKLSLNTERSYWLGVDIGGNNCRVALLFEHDDIEECIHLLKFKATSATILKAGLCSMSAQLKTFLKKSPLGTCVGIAGPVIERTRVTITNYILGDREIQISELDSFAFPPEASIFINDLEGTCGGIQALNEKDNLCKYYTPLWNPTSQNPTIPSNKAALVLAMGTGLGTALIVSDFSKKSHYILPMEAGHIYITPLGSGHENYSRDNELIQFISNQLYQNAHSIEFEDICSGRGVGYVYKFLTGETLDTSLIVKKAYEENDANGLLTMKYVYRMLMRDAQNLCIFSQAKSVFLSGDNQVSNLKFVESVKDELRDEFLNHVKREWLEGVDVWTQTEEANFNLFGAFFLIRKYIHGGFHK